MQTAIYQFLTESKKANRKLFALLIDPDKVQEKEVLTIVKHAIKAKVDLFFVGGSLITRDDLDNVMDTIKSNCSIPVVLFPGSTLQINEKADALFFLSLISGRNAELLIGQHVTIAPLLKRSSLEILPTGYILIDGGAPTTVSYISNTLPIPANKPDIAVCTALAGELLGLKVMYMDAGSGAKTPITEKMIQAVSSQIEVPLIVGGGISTPEMAAANCRAGADVIVVGNAIEKDPALILTVANAVHESVSSIVN
jgi:putative glycerol-1-phosphate prenyltransferase